jgi:hypothetical protein
MKAVSRDGHDWLYVCWPPEGSQWDGPAVLLPCRRVICDRAPWTEEHAMSEKVRDHSRWD